jgi:mRNA interferase HigB
MRVVSRQAILEAITAHPEWRASLNSWYKLAKHADWRNFSDVRNTWRNSDAVGKFVVFDTANNKCRLIAAIKYRWRMVYIRAILAHVEYDEGKWKSK